MEQLGQIAIRRINQYKLGGAPIASQVIFYANKFLLNHFDDPLDVRTVKLQHGTLWIGVKSPSLAQEVMGISIKLLDHLHGQYGQHLIKRIRTKDLTNS